MQKLYLSLTLVLTIFISACQPITVATDGNSVADTPTLQHIDLGVGFVPNVQFAPYYVAQAKGFYADVGLDVALEHGFENDFIALTAQGERQFTVASGDQVILGRAQGLPLVYVMKWYERYPVGIMALADSGIDSPTALAKHSVGIPGLFGASFVAWKALLYATGIDEATIQVQEIGFTQAEAVSQNKVDAAVVYLANEPVQLTEAGLAVNVIEVSEYIDLVSNGVVTSETLIAENPELVAAFVQASLRGLAYTIENPDEAFDIVRGLIPEMTDADAPIQKLVLERSIVLWESDQLGSSSEAAWQTSAEFMLNAGIIETPVDIEPLYTNQFIK